MLEFFENNTTLCIVIIVLALLLLVAIVLIAVLINKRNKLVKAQQDKNVLGDSAVARGQHMTRDGEYFVMSRNVIYNVGQTEDLVAGKYLVKCAVDSDTSVNIRVNGLVQAYDSGITMYLTTGDTISPVSESIIVKLV